MSNLIVFALVDTYGELENTVVRLRTAGLRDGDISVLGSYDTRSASQRMRKASDSNVARPYAGATIGGPLGWLAGAGILSVHDAGCFIAAGPIVSLLSSTRARGTSPVVANSLIDLGLPKSDAGRYAGRVARGALLIAIECEDETASSLSQEILKESCAGSISCYGRSPTETAPISLEAVSQA